MHPNDDREELEALVTEVESQSTDEIIASLKEEGVDTDQFLRRARDTMDQQYQQRIFEIKSEDEPHEAFYFLSQSVSEMNRDDMLVLASRECDINQGQDTESGLDATKLSDDELRSLLRDLQETRSETESDDKGPNDETP
ncbi:hypothetical protein [Rhodopirellula baltica]|uniref:Uncharacterized protein n=1 Tax=Rhodopirellula baltica WH47 TaxID=991778 RepID=F2AWH8_RHOBT|nr:hypothetical protein [Rhodopirellula baltica]EGF25981.1 hypothetical protein RBWH47_04045 [Rhodopirellula baltica WH47]